MIINSSDSKTSLLSPLFKETLALIALYDSQANNTESRKAIIAVQAWAFRCNIFTPGEASAPRMDAPPIPQASVVTRKVKTYRI